MARKVCQIVLLTAVSVILLDPNNTRAQNEIFPIDSQEEIAWVQETLKLIGYKCGPTDGIMGPSTRSCIRSLQRENGLEETGSMGRETYEEMIRALLSPRSEKGVFAESDEQARDDQPESRPESETQPDSTEAPQETAEKEPKSAGDRRDQESDDQPTSTSQTQTTSESQSRSQFEVSPYIGYNNAAGYTVDFSQAIEIEYDPAEDDGSDIASTRGGFVLGLGANIVLSERESFDLRLRPSAEITLMPSENEDFEDANVTLKSSQQYYQFSGDVVAQFNRGESTAPYAGIGITYVRFSGEMTYENVPEDTDFIEEGETVTFSGNEEGSVEGTAIGLNLLGGVRFNDAVDFGVPFVQLRAALVDPRTDRLSDLEAPSLSPAVTVAGGVSFGL
jgi:peptidoglycan hydrolase-like protein with peptidoglycan-binding domain